MYTETKKIGDYNKVCVYSGFDLLEAYKQYECGCQIYGTVISNGAIEWGQLEKRCSLHIQQ